MIIFIGKHSSAVVGAKKKPGNKVLLFLLIPVAVAAFSLVMWAGGTSIRSGSRIGYSGSENRHSWSGSYRTLDGKMWKVIWPEGNLLHIRVETEAGTISIEVKDKEGNVLFSESDMGTGEFDVEVQGRITVRIEADRHRGSFQIDSLEP